VAVQRPSLQRGSHVSLTFHRRPLGLFAAVAVAVVDAQGRVHPGQVQPDGRFVVRWVPPVRHAGIIDPWSRLGPDGAIIDPLYKPGAVRAPGVYRVVLTGVAPARYRGTAVMGTVYIPRRGDLALRWPTKGGGHSRLLQAGDEASTTAWAAFVPGEVYDLAEVEVKPTGGTSRNNPLEQVDSDGDGANNCADMDDDNDGINDDRDDGPFVYDGSENADHDGDGEGDNRDADDDNDGAEDRLDQDDDGDGVKDAADPDDDNDGVEDRYDLADLDHDADEDGLPDEADGDDDGDGIEDAVDDDRDGDGLKDAADPDDDNDGIRDAYEPEDTDSDGLCDAVDPSPEDSNVRAIRASVDWREWQRKYRDDADGDWVPDAQDPDDDGDGVADAADDDRDNDGVRDAEDRDDDNDGLADDLVAKGPDGDGDGVSDAYDSDADGDGASERKPEAGAGSEDRDADGVPDGQEAGDATEPTREEPAEEAPATRPEDGSDDRQEAGRDTSASGEEQAAGGDVEPDASRGATVAGDERA